ncbi:hypothetical protein BDP27DRAFT_1309874 [Rhodocollybia butyracea]|uniref:Uncharacterized protein n=1 Tax=Rhodocollybia butyracea TaxID=206335 RepID=A0A9P5Q536_9AGAR|nr:hypothetical protein BDP27DRAFT_1309874 [Rhodocollybia butyracea]
MTTHGYLIYRYKGLYFIFWHGYDAYPSGLGVKFLGEIPSDPVKFEEYIVAKKEELEGMLEELRREYGYSSDGDEQDPLCGGELERDLGDVNFTISRKWPRHGDAHWFYEIDLEHYIFYVNGEPRFDLRNMPGDDEFCAYLYADEDESYAELPSDTERARHRYKPPPSSVDTSVLDAYREYSLTSKASPIHELLDLTYEMRSSEVIRMKIMEVFIGASMKAMSYRDYGLGERITLFSSSAPPRLIHRVRTMVHTFTGPLILSENTRLFGDRYNSNQSAFEWIEHGILCLLVVPRLDAEHNLPAAVVELVQKSKFYITQTEKESAATSRPTVFFGILSSLYHISVVRIEIPSTTPKNEPDRGGLGKITPSEPKFHVSHTPVLQFLPFRDTKTSSTPGIEALARLGQVVFERSRKHDLVLKNEQFHKTAPSLRGIGSLPTELCLRIAECIPPSYLQAFATLSPQCANAAHVEFQQGGASFEAVKYHILNSRRGRGYDKNRIEEKSCYRILGTASEPLESYAGSSWFQTFQAVDHHGDLVVLVLTWTYSSQPIVNLTSSSRKESMITFGVDTEWCGSPRFSYGESDELE